MEELGRHFIVLAIGRIHVQRHRAAGQPGDARGKALRLDLLAAGKLFAQALLALAADAEPQQRIGQHPAFGQAGQARCVVRQRKTVTGDIHGEDSLRADDEREGNHGNSIGVVRWYSR
ncbi:hypothetical protein D3C71_1302780 [compost metagenome]